MATNFLIRYPSSAVAAGNTDVNIHDSSGANITNGQQTMANSVPVVIASNQSAIPVTSTSSGKTAITFTRTIYSSTNVTTGAWVQLVASLSSTASEIEIFDSSGQTLEIGFGAAASEIAQIVVFPGGNGRVPLAVPSGTRVSIRALSGTANAGEGDINFYG